MTNIIQNNLEKLNEIGIALSSEKNINNLLELIVDESMSITNADGGTLYLMIDNNKRLKFEILKNKTLGINDVAVPESTFYPIKLYNPDTGEPNDHFVAAYCALNGITINIQDAYKEEGFDFSGPKQVDKKFGYRSKSTLSVPLKDHEDKIIGVLQLWNSIDENTGEIVAFEDSQVKLIESLSSQAAVAYNNNKLIKYLEDIFKSLIRYTVKAIDQKTHHTAGHSSRVAKLTRKTAEVISNLKNGKFKDIIFNEDQLEEIWISGLMHDVGKIGTPEKILDKNNKIEKNQFKVIESRFNHIKSIVKLTSSKDNELESKLKVIDEDLSLVKLVNEKGFITKEEKNKIEIIKNKSYFDGFNTLNYLTDTELDCLLIEKGNLTVDERKIMQNHIMGTKDLLNKLTFPEKLKNVPLYAGAHHENIDGNGYPDGLKGDEIPLPAKIMAIADIWDAVTAQDRPYRPPVSDDIACKIIREEVESGKLDGDLVEIFINNEVWKTKH
tara:strand:+ start:287 stop:1777 length:1491 start_codon:yes stop_codon:yes gene_type:complete